MRLYRRKSSNRITIHVEGCRFNKQPTQYWIWAAGKTGAEIKFKLHLLGPFDACQTCKPLDQEEVFE